MITLGYLLLIALFAVSVVFKRRKGYDGLVTEVVVTALMVGVLFVFFVPVYGW